ncbi:MAG: cob(I)yrinic acid a,c-diamide adenosyltransferase [Pseudomonadales bacterium]|jgi:cob(I)alamin adenosyltransferase
MGKRLTKIYTKTGDAGDTGLGDGSRIPKTHARVCAMGDIDELNAQIGLLTAHLSLTSIATLTDIAPFIERLQHRIFDLGGEVSIPGFQLIHDQHVTMIEVELDRMNEALAPLENFIIPGGSILIAQCHVARSVCRRAERSLVSLQEIETVNASGVRFLNRLSDYFFVLARFCALQTGQPECLWQKDDAPVAP